MIVDPSHRAATRVYPPAVYQQLARDCVDALRAIEEVSCIVLCGSAAKSDVVPGWSDLDLIVFLSDCTEHVSVLDAVRRALTAARGTIEIGIGLDLVYEEEFRKTNKLCGRPLAMSYEVAAYGVVCYGEDPFKWLRHGGEAIMEQIHQERRLAIGAEIHNWRRAFVARDPSDTDFVGWAARCVKTTLKLLKYETDPNTSPPFTYDSVLGGLQIRNASHPSMDAFVHAVRLRRDWLSCTNDLKAMEDPVSAINRALARYPLS